MPRPKTPVIYQEKIATLAEEGYRPAAVSRILKEEAEQEDPSPCPSERTVRRIWEEHKQKTPEEQRQYAVFYWPDAMERGDLPWEATRAALDLLSFMDSVGDGRPIIRQVLWYWHVYLADPSQEPLCILINAALLMHDALARTDSQQKAGRGGYTEEIEYRLAYKDYTSVSPSAAQGE